MNLTPSSIRSDLKCGKGSISQGEKCHVGPAERLTGKKTSQAQYESITRNPDKLREFNQAKASTKGAGRKIMRAGEFAANVGAGVASGLGVYNTIGGYLSGDIKRVALGTSTIQAGAAATRVAQASKARRMGEKKLANEFLKSAGRHAAASGAFAGAGYAASRFEKKNNPGKAGSNKAVKDPFKDLGVKANASDAEIKAAWKKAMRTNHPDVGGDPAKAASVNAAYQEILRRRGIKDSAYANGFTVDYAQL